MKCRNSTHWPFQKVHCITCTMTISAKVGPSTSGFLSSKEAIKRLLTYAPPNRSQTCNSYAQCLKHHLGWNSLCSRAQPTRRGTVRKKAQPPLHHYIRKQKRTKFCFSSTALLHSSSSSTSDRIDISDLSIFLQKSKSCKKREGNLTEGTDSQRFQKWKLMENYLTLTQVNWTWESLFKNKEVTMSFPNLWAITWPLISFLKCQLWHKTLT